jgi:hypothetical protein
VTTIVVYKHLQCTLSLLQYSVSSFSNDTFSLFAHNCRQPLLSVNSSSLWSIVRIWTILRTIQRQIKQKYGVINIFEAIFRGWLEKFFLSKLKGPSRNELIKNRPFSNIHTYSPYLISSCWKPTYIPYLISSFTNLCLIFQIVNLKSTAQYAVQINIKYAQLCVIQKNLNNNTLNRSDYQRKY